MNSPLSKDLKGYIDRFAIALSNEAIYGEKMCTKAEKSREYSAATKAARNALEDRILQLEKASLRVSDVVSAAPTAREEIKVADDLGMKVKITHSVGRVGDNEQVVGPSPLSKRLRAMSKNQVSDGMASILTAAANEIDRYYGSMVAWMPIESVPKDGTEVLLLLGAPWNRLATARWYEPWGNWQEGEFPNECDEYCGIGDAVPTHFMLSASLINLAPTAAPQTDAGSSMALPPIPANHGATNE